MEIYVLNSPLEAAGEPLLLAGCFEDEEGIPGWLIGLDGKSGGAISRVRHSGDFRGRAKELSTLYLPPESGAERIVLFGLGKRAELDSESLRRCAAEAALAARRLRTGRIAFAVPTGGALPTVDQARIFVEAAWLGLYQFSRYRSKKPEGEVEVEQVVLVCHDGTSEEELGRSVSLGRLSGECAAFCRDLQNTPAGDATPTWMAEQAEEMARAHGLTFRALDREEMEKEGMGCLLGVARGSDQPPKLVILEHNADRKDLKTVCLVGKGVTFDTGGISIKPAQDMHEMKFDKSGACAVIAVMRAVATLSLPLRVIGIAPLVENMLSGNAYRPGDVLTASNGKTVEVLNTDAEGRLILADALVRATKYEPDYLVDIATLTGACVIALGKHAAGLIANDDDLAARLLAAGESTGERVWRLPLFPDYREQIKSDVADMKNLGGRDAGTITAAALLAEFVGEGKWAHLDIAGVAWRSTDRDYLRKGGTAFGVRLLLAFLRNIANGDPS